MESLKEALHKSREELKQLKSRFKLFSLAEIDSVFISLKGMCVDQNEQAEKMFGYSLEEAYGRMGTDWIVPEDRNKVMDNMLSGYEDPYQVRALKKDGSSFPCEITGRMLNHEGKVYRITTLKDISKRKTAEKDAREHKSLAQQYLNVAGVMVLGLDAYGKVNLINKKGCELLGYREDEILGKTWVDHFIPKRLHKDVTQVQDQVYEGQMETYITFENPILTKDGQERLIRWHNAALKGEHGGIIGTISSGEDITDLRRSETIQQVVYEIANAVHSTVDVTELVKHIHELLGNIIDTSNFFVALKTEMSDKLLDVVYMVDSEDSFDEIPLEDTLSGQVFQEGKSLLLIDGVSQHDRAVDHLPVIGSDARCWLGIPLRSQGEVIGVLVLQSYTDSSAYSSEDQEMLEFVSYQIGLAIERKQREEALKEALVMAEQSDKLKTAFLANVSHEIRTPLNSILGFSELLEDEDLDSKSRKKYISFIHSGGEQLKVIIDDIINISLIESGQIKVGRSLLSANEMLMNTADEHAHQARVNGINISVSELEDCKVLSDEYRIRQVLNNLLSNAIKYCEGSEINLSFKRSQQEIIFAVVDNGKGIDPEYHEKVFERFFQIKDNNLIAKGTGLGLPICKAIVSKLGGKIWLESVPGEGSGFFFSVPLS